MEGGDSGVIRRVSSFIVACDGREGNRDELSTSTSFLEPAAHLPGLHPRQGTTGVQKRNDVVVLPGIRIPNHSPPPPVGVQGVKVVIVGPVSVIHAVVGVDLVVVIGVVGIPVAASTVGRGGGVVIVNVVVPPIVGVPVVRRRTLAVVVVAAPTPPLAVRAYVLVVVPRRVSSDRGGARRVRDDALGGHTVLADAERRPEGHLVAQEEGTDAVLPLPPVRVGDGAPPVLVHDEPQLAGRSGSAAPAPYLRVEGQVVVGGLLQQDALVHRRARRMGRGEAW